MATPILSPARARKRPLRALIAALTVAAVALTPLALGGQPATATVASAAQTAVQPTATQSSAVTLIPLKSSWSYSYASSWPSGWESNGFAHGSWAQGAAPLGWGANATTVVNPADTTTKPVSMLFRKHFTVEDPKKLTDVTISAMVDDGVAVYVNGTEVGRRNLPSGKLSANTYADQAPNASTAKQLVTFTVPRDLLSAGQNTVAASTHVNWRSTPNAAFEATLVARTQGTAPVPPPNQPPAQPPVSPTVCGAQGKYAPACGALWGVYRIHSGDLTKSITNFEAQMGRKFDITLRYHDFSTHMHQGLFPDSHQITLGQERMLLFAWQSRVSSSNTDVAWARIARGEMDHFIDSAADRIKKFGKPVMIAFDPEFDNQKKKGPIGDYVKAYQRIHDRFKAKGVTNVAWLWVSTGYLGAGNDKHIMAGYPGDKYVDWVGFDPYNFYTCNGSGWNTFEQEIAPPYNFFVSQGLGHKPQIIAEYGTTYDPKNQARSNQWNKDIPSVAKKYPNLKALVRFDSNGTMSTGQKCDSRIDNGPGMQESFKQAGLDPYLNTRKK